MSREQRRLAAIMAMDVVGYSRLMGQDEEGVLRGLRRLRGGIIDPLITEFGGRIANTAGDSLLLEFTSVIDALQCGIRIQEQIAEQEQDEKTAIRYRIGLHIGDVVAEGEDLLGDGVNIAARLEGISPTGGICLSDDAYRQLRGRLDAPLEDGGEQELKNIAYPVQVWFWNPQSEPQTGGQADSPDRPVSGGKPSIAVLPFNNMSQDSEQEYFADGITEDIITDLSRFSWLTVIARNSSFSFKGTSPDIREVGRVLGVRYVLEGSVRRAGNRMRITGQLIDASDGSHIWADKFDGVMDDIFDLQDQVTESVVGAIEPSIRQAEINRLRHQPTESLEAYELYLRALSHFHQVSDEHNRTAMELLSRAIELDPDYAIAAALLAWCHVQRRVQNWPLAAEDQERATALAYEVLKNDRADAMAIAYAAHVLLMFAQDMRRAGDAFERSLKENPNSALANALSAICLATMGEAEKALQRADKALLLSPRDTFLYSFLLAKAGALVVLERYEEAVTVSEAAIGERRNFLMSHLVHMAALELNGQGERARAALAEVKVTVPGLNLAMIRSIMPLFNTAYGEKAIGALERIGIPHQPA